MADVKSSEYGYESQSVQLNKNIVVESSEYGYESQSVDKRYFVHGMKSNEHRKKVVRD